MDPSDRLAPQRIVAIGLAALLALAAARPATAEPLDLEGTWYVLIHYQDPKTANPDSMRWKDVVWIFARKGSRLEWSEYPLVVFEDTTGRFERIGGNPRSRVLAAWEPNPAQREAIDDGPRVNTRGMRVKTLKGSDARGWTSPRRMASASPSVMTYQENLTIDGLDALPRFLRQDVVGNAATASSSGGTRYEVESVEAGGRRLAGRYERDGRQRGVFRMWRTKPVRGLPEKDEDDGGAPSDGGPFGLPSGPGGFPGS
jgi:hypothetical protein